MKDNRVTDEEFDRAFAVKSPSIGKAEELALRRAAARLPSIVDDLRDATGVDLNDPDALAQLSAKQQGKLYEALNEMFSPDERTAMDRQRTCDRVNRRAGEFLSKRAPLLGLDPSAEPEVFEGARTPREIYKRMAAARPEAFHSAYEQGQIGPMEYASILDSQEEVPDLDLDRVEMISKPLEEMTTEELEAAISRAEAVQHGVIDDE